MAQGLSAFPFQETVGDIYPALTKESKYKSYNNIKESPRKSGDTKELFE
jgi:hypothetical protein